jgi:hypothetical protein
VIDITAEKLIDLSEAARLRPGSRLDKPTHPGTMARWILKGLRTPAGLIKLEGARLGRKWYTTRQALQRFADQLTAAVPSTDHPEMLSDGRSRPTNCGGPARRSSSCRSNR